MRATEAQSVSLKALADAILARNHSATDDQKPRNVMAAEVGRELHPPGRNCTALEPLPDSAAEARRQRVLAEPEPFTFAPAGDSENDAEALAERSAIMAVENGWDDARALQEARWQADRGRAWRAFLRNGERVQAAPEGEREALLARYRVEAEQRYGPKTALDMAQSLASWVLARAVH